MDQMKELLKQIQELAGIGIDAIDGAEGGEAPPEGAPEGGGPPEGAPPGPPPA